MNYLLANTPILNIQIFSRRYHFRLWVFASTGEYFYCWHWRVLYNVLQSKYDAKTFKYIMYYWAIPEKIQTGGGGVEDIEFPGVSKE